MKAIKDLLSKSKVKMFVHKFKYSHTKLRKYLRREKLNGNVVLLEKKKDGWFYEVPQELYNSIKEKT